MSAMAILRKARCAQARRRRGVDAALRCLPWLVLVAVALAWRLRGAGAALLVFALAVVGHRRIRAVSRARTLDTRWLVRELDARRADMDDSTDLLFAPTADA